MRIALGANHAGVDLKNELIEAVHALGHEPIDYGGDGSDRPRRLSDYADKVGEAIRAGMARARHPRLRQWRRRFRSRKQNSRRAARNLSRHLLGASRRRT